MTDPFYLSKRWKQKRKAILNRDGYVCQYFKRYGKTKPAQVVHHIFPRENFPEYEFASWNLIALSGEAHRLMHNPDGSLSEIGKELQSRAALKRGIVLDHRIAAHQ